jgi:hypothetical protein
LQHDNPAGLVPEAVAGEEKGDVVVGGKVYQVGLAAEVLDLLINPASGLVIP